MAHYFFDTSGLVKRHVIEAGSPWVKSLVRAKAGHTLYISRITAVEVTSAITRRQRGGHLSAAQAGAMLGHFRRHLVQRYTVLEPTPSLLSDAARLARAHGLRAYDAVQLATALEVHSDHQNAGVGPVTLVSADGELNAAATAEGLAVEDPASHK
jgi:predicted nucleic acid-binding protein